MAKKASQDDTVRDDREDSKLDDSGVSDNSVNSIVDQVVAKLKPDMMSAIDNKTSAIMQSLREDLKEIRASIENQPKQSSNIDLKGIAAEAEKFIPGISGLIGNSSQTNTSTNNVGMAAGNNGSNTGRGTLPPPPRPGMDPFEYAAFLESNPQQNQAQIPQQQGQGLNLPTLLMLMNNPVVQNLLGVQQPNQGMNQIVGAFMQLAMNNAMADIQTGSFLRKSLIMQGARNNPLLADYAQMAIKAEDSLVGKPLEVITSPQPQQPNNQPGANKQ